METTKSSVVVLFGRPNVGKSTIFNCLQKNVYAITTRKAQTTRNHIIAKVEINPNEFLILIDTPGFHRANNKLDLFLNSEVKTAIKMANVACYILDPTRPINEEDAEIIKYMNNVNSSKKVLVVNKIDKVKESEVEACISEISKFCTFDNVFKISAINKLGIDEYYNFLLGTIDQNDLAIDTIKEPRDEFIVQEIIRESCLELLDKEIPYGISIEVNKFDYESKNNLLTIDANIYVEKESHKGIVVGKAGSMIKKIGIDARKKLLEIFDCNINLQLYVKTKSDWRNNDELLKLLGYRK